MARTSGRAAGPRWSAQRRLEFIEFRLFWQGALNRRDLREQFGISDQQASADIAAYQQAAPGNCAYDRNAKMYVPGDGFAPVFGPPDSQIYLNELRSVDYGITTREESRIGKFPTFATVPYPKRSVDVGVLRKVLRAIEIGQALRVLYQSFSRPEPIWRWITPHALGYDGHRWHARAFCHRRGAFSDFVLGRILETRDVAPHEVDRGLDREWAEAVELEIGTHPDLRSEQRAAVEFDHNMTKGRVAISVRAALVFYLMRWMRADLDPKVVGPEQSQIVLLNKASVDRVKAALREETVRLVREAGVARLEVD